MPYEVHATTRRTRSRTKTQEMGGIVGGIKRKVSQVVDFQHSCETFCGAEGTRTLDLRRDRPAF